MSDSFNDLRRMVDHLASELYDLEWSGPNYAKCDWCGEMLGIGTDEDWPADLRDGADEDGDPKCPHCEHDLPERPEPYSWYDWILDNALDIEFTINGRGDYIGARVFVTVGGPGIWIDTRDNCVRGAWGTDRAESGTCVNSLDESLECYYEDCIRA